MVEEANYERGCCLLALQLALAESQYDLAAELLRFVVPPTENDKMFASITGANGVTQHPGAAKDASPAPPRVWHQLLFYWMFHLLLGTLCEGDELLACPATALQDKLRLHGHGLTAECGLAALLVPERH